MWQITVSFWLGDFCLVPVKTYFHPLVYQYNSIRSLNEWVIYKDLICLSLNIKNFFSVEILLRKAPGEL